MEEKRVSDYIPEMFFTSKLMVRHDPGSKCPTIDRIFRQFVTPDRMIDFCEMAAYCFLRSYPNQKFIFIYGDGFNGKSTYGNILMRLLERRNVCVISLQSFQTNRFAAAELYKRYANINIEVDYRDLNRTDTINKLTGGDPIMAELKYGHPFNFTNYAKLLFW